jgi:hypothetical protein
MKAFLKDNIALVAAIALPLLLAAIFGLSTVFVNSTVEDPKNDFLILTNYNPNNTGYKFNVQNDSLNISFTPQKDSDGKIVHSYNERPRLWRIYVPEMSVEEISLKNPDENKETASIEIPGITNLKIRNVSPGPDGYTFINFYRGSSSNLMTELFAGGGGHNDRYIMALEKKGRHVPFRISGDNYSTYNTRFLGWIIEE